MRFLSIITLIPALYSTSQPSEQDRANALASVEELIALLKDIPDWRLEEMIGGLDIPAFEIDVQHTVKDTERSTTV